MDPPISTDPVRRSTRYSGKAECEEQQRMNDLVLSCSVYESDCFSDPRTRIRNPELLDRLNEFLKDIGTDPDQIDVNYPDLASPLDQRRVFYVPRLGGDIKIEPHVPENAEMNPEGLVDVNPGSQFVQPEMNMAIMFQTTQKVDDEGPVVKMETHSQDITEVTPEQQVPVYEKTQSPLPGGSMTLTSNQNAADDDLDLKLETSSLTSEKVENEDSNSKNDLEISYKLRSRRNRNFQSNCVLI